MEGESRSSGITDGGGEETREAKKGGSRTPAMSSSVIIHYSLFHVPSLIHLDPGPHPSMVHPSSQPPARGSQRGPRITAAPCCAWVLVMLPRPKAKATGHRHEAGPAIHSQLPICSTYSQTAFAAWALPRDATAPREYSSQLVGAAGPEHQSRRNMALSRRRPSRGCRSPNHG